MKAQKNRVVVALLALTLTVVLASTYLYPTVKSWAIARSNPTEPPVAVTPDPQPTPQPQPEPDLGPAPYVHPKVKGIHVSAHVVATPHIFEPLLAWVDETILNALVLEAKDEHGKIPWVTEVPLARELRLYDTRMRNIADLIKRLESMDIYPIARVVTFKDPALAEAKPEWAVQHQNGGIWRDKNKMAWLDPYNREAWAYILEVAKEAVDKGFRDIQFDYVRFPSDGQISTMRFKHDNGASRAETIREFLKYAKSELEPLGVRVSADIFGLVTVVRTNDMGIGQVLEEVAAGVDVLSPMVYPEHYALGTFGIKDPDKEPYQTVLKSLQAARERLANTPHSHVIMRPWLQDFSLRHKYGIEEIRAQLKAVEDAGYEEWLLWDPRCRYTRDAIPKK